MYKRPGQRVIVNSRGDMLVRPSFIEMSLARTTGAVNLAHHLLGSYQKALLSIVRLQFSEDSIEGGYEGMLRIANTLKHVGFFLVKTKKFFSGSGSVEITFDSGINVAKSHQRTGEKEET